MGTIKPNSRPTYLSHYLLQVAWVGTVCSESSWMGKHMPQPHIVAFVKDISLGNFSYFMNIRVYLYKPRQCRLAITYGLCVCVCVCLSLCVCLCLSSLSLLFVLFCFYLLCFETGSHVCHAGLQLTLQLRVTQNSCPSCVHLWDTGTGWWTGWYSHTWFI